MGGVGQLHEQIAATERLGGRHQSVFPAKLWRSCHCQSRPGVCTPHELRNPFSDKRLAAVPQWPTAAGFRTAMLLWAVPGFTPSRGRRAKLSDRSPLYRAPRRGRRRALRRQRRRFLRQCAGRLGDRPVHDRGHRPAGPVAACGAGRVRHPGSTGSTTAASCSPSVTFPQWSTKRPPTANNRLRPWRPDSCNWASGEPGAVHRGRRLGWSLLQATPQRTR
jgi:hypothetical protein